MTKKLFAKACVVVAMVAIGLAWFSDADAQPVGGDPYRYPSSSAPVSDFGPSSSTGRAGMDVVVTAIALAVVIAGSVALVVYTRHVAPQRAAAERSAATGDPTDNPPGDLP